MILVDVVDSDGAVVSQQTVFVPVKIRTSDTPKHIWIYHRWMGRALH